MSRTLSQQQAALDGENFLIVFFRALKAIKLHEDNNELVQQALAHLDAVASGILANGELTILILDGGFYIQGRRFRYHRKTGRNVREWLDTFADTDLCGFTFHTGFLSAPAEEKLKFLRLMIQSAGMEDRYGWLTGRLREQNIFWVEILDEERAKELRDKASDAPQRAKDTYRKSLSSVREITQRLARGINTGISKADALMHNMTELVSENEPISLGLATIKHYDDYTYVHSVNVAVMAICLGRRIGLSKDELSDLGICGLFHDLGKIDIPREIIQKPGALDDREWQEIRKHPLTSMKLILDLKAPHQIKSRIFLAPLEHHLNFDLSGYPAIKFKTCVSLFGRILKIVDVYDAITSPRIYRKSYYSPDQALKFMLKKSGKEFDPVLLKVFAAMLGRYPMGTLLVLDTDEIGLVNGQSAIEPQRLPRVILLEKNLNGDFIRGEEADLGEIDPLTGNFRKKISRSFHPAVCGIQPADFILEN